MDRPSWAPPEVDLTRASAARMYDYFLGGSHNFAVDRSMANQLKAAVPDVERTMRANRTFLRRAVRFLLDAGVRQFLDLGSGIPTVGNVHEIAAEAAPPARVAYVDIDPVAVAHSRALLGGVPNAGVVQADLRDPRAILSHPDVNKLLDLDEPVAVMLVAVLHFLPDSDDPAGIVATLRDALAPGSYVTISHGCGDSRPDDGVEVARLYQRTANPVTPRSRGRIHAMFDGFDLVDPGLVWATQWHPESPEDVGDAPERISVLVGVGRKPPYPAPA